MFKHFVITNFRCFAGLHLQQLERVNLIAGKNNTGKTALLEAIHIHNNPANWQLPIEINKERGILNPSKALEEVCGWLFYGGNYTGGLSLGSQDDKGISRTLKMFIFDHATSRQWYPQAEQALAARINPALFHGSLPRLIMKYEEPGQPEQVSIGVAGTMVAGGFGGTWIDARIPWNIRSIFLGSSGAEPPQDEALFGAIEKAKRQEEILPALQIVEPRLLRLSLAPLAGESVIHGDIGLPQLVPLPFMGEGLRRVLSIVLAIANASGGVVLIDEVENGLHYSAMKDVWRSIALAARRGDVQVFATTHSWECIQAAHHAFKENGPYELRYHRLDRVAGQIKVKSLDEQGLTRIETTDLEIR